MTCLSFLVQTVPTISEDFMVLKISNSSRVTCLAISIGWSWNDDDDDDDDDDEPN